MYAPACLNSLASIGSTRLTREVIFFALSIGVCLPQLLHWTVPELPLPPLDLPLLFLFWVIIVCTCNCLALNFGVRQWISEEISRVSKGPLERIRHCVELVETGYQDDCSDKDHQCSHEIEDWHQLRNKRRLVNIVGENSAEHNANQRYYTQECAYALLRCAKCLWQEFRTSGCLVNSCFLDSTVITFS